MYLISLYFYVPLRCSSGQAAAGVACSPAAAPTKNYKTQARIVRDNRTQKIYSAISFTTMQLPCFNTFKDLFYNNNVKKVPDNIYELLTPKGLAF